MRCPAPLVRLGACLVLAAGAAGCGSAGEAPRPGAAAETSAAAEPGAVAKASAATRTGALEPGAVAAPAVLAGYRRWVSARYLELQEATIALQDATEARDVRSAQTAWSRADGLRARVGIAYSDDVAADLRAVRADLWPAAVTGRTADAARNANDDAARARRTRLNAPMSAAALAAEPRRILELASGELSSGGGEALASAFLGARERALAPLPSSFVRAERLAGTVRSGLAPGGGANPDLSAVGVRRRVGAALGAALEDLAGQEPAQARTAAGPGGAA